jgi:segregation and condensation protein B
MSLKARIEAVIYAAEEPVTLAQLAGLFQEEALELRREREAAASLPETIAEMAGGEVVSDPMLHLEALENAEAEAVAESDAAPAPVSEEEIQQPDAAAAVTDATLAADAAPSVEDEKKAARLRDREIREEIRRVVDELMAEYESGGRGMEIREVAGGYRVATRPEYHDSVREFVKSLKPPMKLSLQALETLAVIAYKQPVTAPEIGEIRGVDSAGVLGSLISRKLVNTAGRKQVIGRPILYKTTKEFLLRFGLKDLNELPSMEEFEKMASELTDSDTVETQTEPEAQIDELPFAQNGIAEIEEATVAAETGEPDAEDNEEEFGDVAVGVADESVEEHAEDVPGVAVSAEVEPAEMTDAGEVNDMPGQPVEGD